MAAAGGGLDAGGVRRICRRIAVAVQAETGSTSRFTAARFTAARFTAARFATAPHDGGARGRGTLRYAAVIGPPIG